MAVVYAVPKAKLRPGAAAHRACVYSCAGCARMALAEPYSTTRPAHHGDLVADLRRDPQVVGDENHGELEAGADVLEQRQHLRLHGHVERRDRLVRDQQLGLHGERSRDADALALAARKLVRIAPKRRRIHSNELHQLAGAGERRSARQAVVARSFHDRLADRAPGIQRAIRVLEHDLNPAAQRAQLPRTHRREVDLPEADFARSRLDEAQDAASHRRLARPRFADDSQRLALAHLQVHVLGGLHVAPGSEPAPVDVGLRQAFRAKNHRRLVVCASHGRLEGGYRAHEHPRVFMPRPRKHLVARADFDPFSELEHRHAVCDVRDDAEVMGDEEHRHASTLLDVRDEFQDLRLRGHVEGGGRLVGDEQRRLQRERHGDHDALALPAGELVRIGSQHACRLRQGHFPEDGEHFVSSRFGRVAGVKAKQLVQLRAAGHDRIERRCRFLEDHRHAGAAQLPPARLGRRSEVLAFEKDLSVCHVQRLRQQSHDRLGDHAFPGARFSDQAEDFAFLDAERNVRDG
jgi:hypothetical protein